MQVAQWPPVTISGFDLALITDISLWALIRHLGAWLNNLRRAGDARKRQSIKALRRVITAARTTRAYLRKLNDTARQDHAQEAKLAEKWTRLGFELQDLGLGALAKRCDITGRYWADPAQFEPEFLDKADVGLARMEQLARQMVAEIETS
jgi:hypothetical protein